jgi:hypothetical protein
MSRGLSTGQEGNPIRVVPLLDDDRTSRLEPATEALYRSSRPQRQRKIN